VTFGTSSRGLSGATARSRPLLAVPNVTAHPSTASVPITVLLYNGRLLCGFNVPIKGFSAEVQLFSTPRTSAAIGSTRSPISKSRQSQLEFLKCNKHINRPNTNELQE